MSKFGQIWPTPVPKQSNVLFT